MKKYLILGLMFAVCLVVFGHAQGMSEAFTEFEGEYLAPSKLGALAIFSFISLVGILAIGGVMILTGNFDFPKMMKFSGIFLFVLMAFFLVFNTIMPKLYEFAEGGGSSSSTITIGG